MLSCGSGDSCENSGDAPPTRACDAGPNRLSAVLPAAFRISSGTRPTDGMYAGGYPQSSPKTTRCCGILPTATTISGASAIWDAPHRPACGSAADTRWTPCGRYRPSCPRYPASGSHGGPSERGPARSIVRTFYRAPRIARTSGRRARCCPPRPSGPPPTTSRPPPATSRPPPATSRPPPATSRPPPATSRPPPATWAALHSPEHRRRRY